ncbi:hypothetical protein POY69_19300 [Phocaeicola vulgatus]|uniref:hypothetical protein n=1 Tax=Phocaeicola vulgatus TaxID=821 RepID=UPI001899DB06|nr:hypothetical protein [Phocaeicola vulgatus]MDB0754615.1 hypothetical protein [Phocaeicola vulgatus]MDB0770642.1 hypothetical protein [Phocaeicola vulgatus]MDC1695907.1 hypothetical protein [Phocaeicola vulgatus]
MNKLRPTIKLALFISVASLFFAACSDDDDKSIPVPEPSGQRIFPVGKLSFKHIA